MKFFIVFFALALAGCGSDYDGGPVSVAVHHVEPVELFEINGGDENGDGYTIWKTDDDGNRVCDIYIFERARFPTEEFYNAALGHELRHCFEGDFH